MSHVADSRKNRPSDPISGPFQGVLPPSGPRIMGAEEATHFLAQRKRGWPLSTLFLDTTALPPLATTPPSAGTNGDRPRADPPADYCMQPIAKAERGPIATSGPSLLVCHRTRRFLQTKSIRFSPLAAAQPLTILSGPETLNASGSGRACRMARSRNASSLLALPDFPEFAPAVRQGVPGTQGESGLSRISAAISAL